MSSSKKLFMLERIMAFVLLIIISPLLFTCYILVKITSTGAFIYKQKRTGKNKKPFYIYKIRTMIQEADKVKHKYIHLNQADGPVFKIFNDPRYTKVGKWLSKTGLDELPQLMNIMKGEMSFVGPRPLPIEEAARIPKKYESRFSILPGITSPWVVKGSHTLKFSEWMELDVDYVNKKNIWLDLTIIVKTIKLILLFFLLNVKKIVNR